MEPLVQPQEYQSALKKPTKSDEISYASKIGNQEVICLSALNSVSDIFCSSLCLLILSIAFYLKQRRDPYYIELNGPNHVT